MTVGPGMYRCYWDGTTKLPPDFAARYAPGETLARGFGTGYRGTYSGRLDPSLSQIPHPDPRRDSTEAAGICVEGSI